MLIKKIEKLLIQQRGYITKIPKKGDYAISMISGGIDSITLISFLIEKYNLIIYPLFIKRGQKNEKYEERAVNFFNKWFLVKYPNNYKNIFKLELDVPPKKLRANLLDYSKKKGIPLRDPILQSIAVQYAINISEKNNFNLRYIFTGINSEDPFPHSNLLSLRIQTLSVCSNTGDFTWQITSPYIDPCMTDKIFSKKDIILFANKVGLPLEKTRSCYLNKKEHCGNCMACKRRKQAFRDAGVKDKTKYL
ncbi:MAG: hypothetical protein B6U88_00875 [Candidatus Aenigmarchaeota archaeon ex4484_56]|nr:MAG: hypothetical protein B6U88_00875 [Candidatus Aenigmarchaeota archaeon ex4484_56]